MAEAWLLPQISTQNTSVLVKSSTNPLKYSTHVRTNPSKTWRYIHQGGEKRKEKNLCWESNTRPSVGMHSHYWVSKNEGKIIRSVTLAHKIIRNCNPNHGVFHYNFKTLKPERRALEIAYTGLYKRVTYYISPRKVSIRLYNHSGFSRPRQK